VPKFFLAADDLGQGHIFSKGWIERFKGLATEAEFQVTTFSPGGLCM
jgi:hypothetical protein